MRSAIRPYAAVLLGFLLAVPVMAFADPADPSAGALNALNALEVAALGALLKLALPYLGAAGLALVGSVFWGIGKAVKMLQPGKVRHALEALAVAGKRGATYVEQKVAPVLRGPDGKLPDDAKAKAFDAAKAAAWDYVRMHGLEDIKQTLGLSDADLDRELGVEVEVAVKDLPSVAPVPTPEETAAAAKLSPSQVGTGLDKMTTVGKALVLLVLLLCFGLAAPVHAEAPGVPVVAMIDAGLVDVPLALDPGQPAPAAGWWLSDARARVLVAHEADCQAALSTLGETSGVSPKVILAGAAGVALGAAATLAVVFVVRR